jgi:hypothetical protein
MRLFTPVPLALAAAAALLSLPAPAHAASAPTCAAPDSSTFPLTTRIHGGPDTYEAGGGYGTWYLDLTNTTRRICENIHPVVVLVDEERALKPSQPHLEFYDGPRARPVRLETTDEDELVGAFGGDGFTIGPGKTFTVKVRLTFTSDAVPNEVTVNAAVVQRRDDDGDWVGQSNDYRFAVDVESENPVGITDGDRFPYAEGAGQLARTGLGSPCDVALAAAALLVTGGAMLSARRLRLEVQRHRHRQGCGGPSVRGGQTRSTRAAMESTTFVGR